MMPSGVYKRTEENKQNIRKARIGKKDSEEIKKNNKILNLLGLM
jgi:hypothetical protein